MSGPSNLAQVSAEVLENGADKVPSGVKAGGLLILRHLWQPDELNVFMRFSRFP